MKIAQPITLYQSKKTTVSIFCKRTVEWAQTNETFKKCDYFRQQYLIEFFLSPAINTLLPTTAPLLRFTLSGIIVHPLITYYNELQKRSIFSELFENKLNFHDFIKSEFLNLSSSDTQSKVSTTIISGVKLAMMGPFFTYLGMCILPKAYGALINAILVSIAKSIITYIFFQNANNAQIPFIIMLLTGSLRGAIFCKASEFFNFLHFEYGDVFYLSMWTRQIVDPIIKFIEQPNIIESSKQTLQNFYQYLTDIASKIASSLKNNPEINYKIIQLYFQMLIIFPLIAACRFNSL